MEDLQKCVNQAKSALQAVENVATDLLGQEAQKMAREMSPADLAKLMTETKKSYDFKDLNKLKEFVAAIKDIQSRLTKAEWNMLPRKYDSDEDVRYGYGR